MNNIDYHKQICYDYDTNSYTMFNGEKSDYRCDFLEDIFQNLTQI